MKFFMKYGKIESLRFRNLVSLYGDQAYKCSNCVVRVMQQYVSSSNILL